MVPLKIQCGCGQRYAFDVEPVNGRLPATVACPACGADGTEAGNQILGQIVPTPAAPAAVRIAKAVHAVPAAYIAPPVYASALGTLPAKGAAKSMTWYEQIWIALPIALVAIGGAIGGGCGGAAWAINKKVFKQVENPVLRYVYTGLISFSAVVIWLMISVFFVVLFRRR